MSDVAVPVAAAQRRWAQGLGRIVFPGIFLVYVLQTATGIERYSGGAMAVVGGVGIAAFCATYLLLLATLGSGRRRRFWGCWWALVALCAVEVAIAHEYAFSMFVFVGVPLIAVLGVRALPVVAALVATAFLLPAVVPAWHQGVDVASGFSTAIILLAMFAFFGMARANEELALARSEIARLAAENERTRIARDLHDLLGHSLTAITVKSALARRLSGADPQRAAGEIGEVEQLTRRAMAELRAVVTGYRDVTLAGELATGAEILRAAGITARVEGDVDAVRPELTEVFGWVVRESITNVVRHAHAGSCTVRLGADWIEIEDDGIGVPGAAGSGLTGLRERTEAAGSSLDAGPRDGAGWRVRVARRVEARRG